MFSCLADTETAAGASSFALADAAVAALITVVVVVQFVFVKSSVNLTGVVLLNVLPMLLLSWPGIKETRAIKFIQSHKKIECKEVLAFMTQRSSFTYVMSTFFHFIANTLNILFLRWFYAYKMPKEYTFIHLSV